ncbi:MAG TPA: 3-hydroxyacyl-ACP dehydratase FabZ [Paracoccaceae bacterium]|nr:3-hydroxyacyl-ACP dehydratase FabZ [Paracoccaceae bacterium]
MSDEKDESGEQLDILDIKRAIPHRYPFLLIDRITSLRRGHSAVGIKNVTANEQFFEGHFPEHPVMPGVLVIEALAQTAAVLVVRGLDVGDNHDLLVYFMGIDKARFRQPVRPGDQLELHVTLDRSRGKVWRFAGEARVNGCVCAEAEFMAMIMHPEDLEKGKA